jgi:hypothetical protein
MRALVSFEPSLRELSAILINEHTSDVARRELRPSVDLALAESTVKVQSTGAMRMDKIIELATTLPGYELSYFQRCCMDAVLPIIAPIVFRNMNAEIALYFKKTNRRMVLQRMLFMQTSRRSGKTDLLTILASIFLVVIPNLEMLCWSLYNETSELFGRTMAKWLVDLGYGHIARCSSDHVILRMANDDVRTIYLMGSQNPNAARSKGCQIGFIDEAKFFKPETIRSGPLAMLLQKAVLIFASTPEINDDPCKGIIEGEYNGEKICEYVNFELTCPDCKLICEKNPAHLCDHRQGWRSVMHDPEIVGILQVAMGSPNDFQREVMGTQMTSSSSFIPKEYIESLQQSKWYTFPRRPDYLFFSCDPNGSSLHWENAERSFYAMVCFAVMDGQAIVSFIYCVFYSRANWWACSMYWTTSPSSRPSNRWRLLRFVLAMSPTLGAFALMPDHCSWSSQGMRLFHSVQQLMTQWSIGKS